MYFFSKGRKGIWIASNLVAFTLLIGAVDYSTTINKGYQKYFSKEEEKLKKAKKQQIIIPLGKR